ncbi:MAG TPA: DUF1501 domain-containing protein [Planctomycetota bacterium]|nr:DUF1501 domain-containing protein [Planctomycetota bacterium]
MNYLSRREFLKTAGYAGLAASALPNFARAEEAQPVGKAEHCIFIWLGGGMAQIDTFDPKGRGDGKKVPGCYYDTIDTAIQGAKVCKHLSRCAPILDRFILFRTVHHDVVDEHAAATNRLHTGRPTSGTVVYPSVGSVISHQRGTAAEGVPAYVVMGYPNLTRGPGFLGSKYGYLYLIDTDSGPNGLSRPPEISAERQSRREALLTQVRGEFRDRTKADKAVEEYDSTVAESFRLAGPRFMDVFDLKKEPAALREAYGGEFGQRCLLARRLVQAGVRFSEVSFNLNFLNGTGWDTHNQGQLQQHALIEELDKALATLVLDLEKNKLLDKTLVVVATEFGRPPGFDGGGGRGHQSKAFSCVMAGGGLKTGQVIGETDDLSKTIAKRPVSVPDFHATMYAALGINPDKYLYDDERPVPITDQGKAVREVFA